MKCAHRSYKTQPAIASAVPMKLERWTVRGGDVATQFLRQLAVGLITGGVIGLAFMPEEQNVLGIFPVSIGMFLALIGLIKRKAE